MTKKLDIYKCELCGNVIEVEFSGGGELVCCGQPMDLQAPNTVDAAKEKHVPVILSEKEGCAEVQIGEVAHPMTADHYIMWIGSACDKCACRTYLKPGDEPKAEVCKCEDGKIKAYCNLHGLWEI
ncbi:desulfoferrodoxin [Candidatus Margulisiibacteriota bacterium]